MGVKNYKVNIKPLELYTFGTEVGAKFDGVQTNTRESYIITSNIVPDQTTLLGTLRYIVLQMQGLLNLDYDYDGKESLLKDAIGGSSFIFGPTVQDFGMIKKLSPVFLRKVDEIYIANPFHNCGKDEYTPMQMMGPVKTSSGDIHIPVKDKVIGYDAKEGHGSGYIGIDSKKIVSTDKIFKMHLLVGNQTNHSNPNNKDGFFKRETYSMDEHFCFSLYVEAEEGAFPDKTVAYMGKKQNAFLFTFEETTTTLESFKEQLENRFRESNEEWYYAFSDLYLSDCKVKYENFAFVEEKYIRNLITTVTEKDLTNRRKKHERIHLISRGSSFYKQAPDVEKNCNCENIGYNWIIKMGGNK